MANPHPKRGWRVAIPPAHKPASPWQGRKAGGAGWDRSPKTCFPPRRPDFQRPGYAQAGPKGCSLTCWGKPGGQRPELSGELVPCLGANERHLMRCLCQQREPGPSHCQLAGKAQARIPPQSGPLVASQNILEQAGEGVPAPPLCQPFLFKGYLPQVLQDYRGRGERRGLWRSELRKSPPTLLFHSRRAGERVKHSQDTHLPASRATGLLLTCSSTPHGGPEAQAPAAGDASHPPRLEKRTLWKGGAWTPGFQENAHLLQPTCSRHC